MAASSAYRRYMQLLEKWPIDKTKKGRDFGQFLRDNVKVAFSSGEISKSDESRYNKQIDSLTRLADNTYETQYKRTSSSSATGLNAEQCNQILSSDFLQYLEEENQGLISSFFRKSTNTN